MANSASFIKPIRGVLTCLPHPYVKRWLGWYFSSESGIPLYLIKADNWTDDDLALCKRAADLTGGKILFWDDIWDAGVERHKRKGKHCAYGIKQDWWQRFIETEAPDVWAWLDSDLRTNRRVDDLFNVFDRLPSSKWAMMPSYYCATGDAPKRFAKRHGDIEWWNCCCVFRRSDELKRVVDDMVEIGHKKWLPDEDAFTWSIKKRPELRAGISPLNGKDSSIVFLDGLEPSFDASAKNRASVDFVHYGGAWRQLIFQGYREKDICPDINDILSPKRFKNAVVGYVRSMFLHGWLAAYEQSGSRTPLVLFQNIDWSDDDIKLAQDTVSRIGGCVVLRSYEPLLRTCDMYVVGNYNDRKFGRIKARNFGLKLYLYRQAMDMYADNILWLDDDCEVIGSIDTIFSRCMALHNDHPEKTIFSNRSRWKGRRIGQFGAVLLLRESRSLVGKAITEAEAGRIILDDEMGLKELGSYDAAAQECVGFWSDYRSTMKFTQDSSWVSREELERTKHEYSVVHWYVIDKQEVAKILNSRTINSHPPMSAQTLRVYVSSGF